MKFWSNWKIYSTSFTTGVFPSVLKTAKVVLVFKKDSKLDYSSYHPISLLSNIEKILEKRIYKRLYTFFNKNNVIYNLQFGFRQQYSTSHALINITENIRKALDDGNIGCGVFVDLQKAFDTVDHQILLAKLNHYGIRWVSNDCSPSVFNAWFRFFSDQHSYETPSSTQGNLIKLFYKPKRYGKYSITVSAVESWKKNSKTTKRYAT